MGQKPTEKQTEHLLQDISELESWPRRGWLVVEANTLLVMLLPGLILWRSTSAPAFLTRAPSQTSPRSRAWWTGWVPSPTSRPGSPRGQSQTCKRRRNKEKLQTNHP